MQKIISKHEGVWAMALVLATIATLLGICLGSWLVFIFSGVLIGIFYGWNNYRIFHYPHTDEFYKEYLTREKQGFEKNPPAVNTFAKINERWVHIVCGVTGSIALFFLSTRINFRCLSKPIGDLSFTDGVLFIIALLGYTGLMPRTLWFLANRGGLADFLNLDKKAD